jgi:hypothetical protein
MATVGTNRPSGYDHHHNHHQNPLQADDEFSLRHMMDAEPTGPNDGRDILSGSKSIPATGAGSSNNGVVDITATQKMVSAMSGSLLTSLLGMSLVSFSIRFMLISVAQLHPSMSSAYACSRKKHLDRPSISLNSQLPPLHSLPLRPPNSVSHPAVAKFSSPVATPNSVSLRLG